ncbi:MAG TPA: DUF1343 domain-containing protein [Planctomycetota bacterium]|nr:DUF1343 domain-containing protein [Planctomycetota bacterium]
MAARRFVLSWLPWLAATAAAQANGDALVRTGIDVVAAGGAAPALRGRHIGLVTNQTGRTSDGRRTVDVLAAADGVRLVALFSPEHGWNGVLDAVVDDTVDEATGLPVHSLYGATRAPTAQMLQGLDTLVFDIQDIGCRFYTYVSTMRNCLEAAAANRLRFVVLDRPNPLGGLRMEGPVLAAERRDFTGAHRIPVRHGLTVGELARMIVGEDGVEVDLVVVPCEGWHRADLWDRTGLPWIDPSPNMRSLTEALLYPGIGLLEATNLSVGRGTGTPFEVLGAPWCDGLALAAALRAAGLPGVTFVPVHFEPSSSRFHGERCSGVHVIVTDWRTFEPVRTGVQIACTLHALHATQWDTSKLDRLLKHEPSCRAMLAGEKPADIVAGWRKELDLFRMRRQPFLLYE